MLFTIAIAPLHWLFARAYYVGALSGLRLPPSQPRVSLYADDAALFVSPAGKLPTLGDPGILNFPLQARYLGPEAD